MVLPPGPVSLSVLANHTHISAQLRTPLQAGSMPGPPYCLVGQSPSLLASLRVFRLHNGRGIVLPSQRADLAHSSLPASASEAGAKALCHHSGLCVSNSLWGGPQSFFPHSPFTLV